MNYNVWIFHEYRIDSQFVLASELTHKHVFYEFLMEFYGDKEQLL